MITKPKTIILFKLEERNMSLEDLDELLGRPSGYSSYVICNSKITTFAYDEIEKIADFFKLTMTEKISLQTREDNTTSDDYILHVLDFVITDEEIMNTLMGSESKLMVLGYSRSEPGKIRDVTLENLENHDYRYFPINPKRGEYVVAGPTYMLSMDNGLQVYFAKAISNDNIDDDYSVNQRRPLNVICLADRNNHMIDFIEAELTNFNHMKKESELYYKIQGVYERFLELFEDVLYCITE